MENNNVMKGPLSGVKVVELATVVAAPTTSRMLCAYGADVIKVEALWGDELRKVGNGKKVPCEDYKNPMFTLGNSNKRLTAINIKSEAGREALFKLLSEADIFVTNVREQSLKKIGLDYESLKQKYPRLIYAQLYGFGPLGPAANDPGFDSTAFWMRSGPLGDWTEKGSKPFYPTYAFGDVSTSSVLLSGILMALYARTQTGVGSMVSTSLFATGIWYNGTGIVSTQFAYKDLNPDYSRPPSPFDGFYECGDGNWLAIYSNEYTRDREKISKHLHMEDIMQDHRWDSIPNLIENDFIVEAAKRVSEVFKTKGAYEWREDLNHDNISCEVMRKTRDVIKDEQALANNYVEEVEFAGGLKVMMPCPPIKFSNFARKPYENVGRVGENTDEIFLELGYTQEEINEMKGSGAIK